MRKSRQFFPARESCNDRGFAGELLMVAELRRQIDRLTMGEGLKSGDYLAGAPLKDTQ